MKQRLWMLVLLCVPFVGQWLLYRELRRSNQNYDRELNRLTASKIGKVSLSETGIEASFQNWMAPHIAQSAWDCLTENDAENYVELKLNRPDDPPGRWITVTVQRWNGMTPADKADAAIQEASKLRARVAELEEQNRRLEAKLIEHQEAIAALTDGKNEPVYKFREVIGTISDCGLSAFDSARYGWDFCQEQYRAWIAALLPREDDCVPK